MSEELKPCPFCGGEADLREVTGGFFVVYCTNIKGCALNPTTLGYETQEEAAEAWNRRAE